MPPLQFYNDPLPGVDPRELQGKLIVIEGPDSVGRSTQVTRLHAWLERQGHAVLDTGLARGPLAGRGIARAKEGNTLGAMTMTLFYATDFADRLENEIIPALRAGFVVLTDRYIFSLMARGIARGEDPAWLEKLAGFALVPHAIYYLRADVNTLVSRLVLGSGQFDFWESGMDVRLAPDRYESYIRYQTKIIRALDKMAEKYNFTVIDAAKSPDAIFRELQRTIGALFQPPRTRMKEHAAPAAKAPATAKKPRRAKPAAEKATAAAEA
jgi:dTMP kinase